MAQKAWHSAATMDTRAAARGDWLKSMSNHVATALLAYTGVLIFLTMGAIQKVGGMGMGLFALVVLVAFIIPMFRNFERRWERKVAGSDDAVLAGEFRRQTMLLWLLALGLPFGVTALAMALFAAG